jgi:hypothetical protein
MGFQWQKVYGTFAEIAINQSKRGMMATHITLMTPVKNNTPITLTNMDYPCALEMTVLIYV